MRSHLLNAIVGRYLGCDLRVVGRLVASARQSRIKIASQIARIVAEIFLTSVLVGSLSLTALDEIDFGEQN